MISKYFIDYYDTINFILGQYNHLNNPMRLTNFNIFDSNKK